MSKAGISINVSGGSANFGNINQGDKAQLSNDQVISVKAPDIERFYQLLETLVGQHKASREEMTGLKLEIAQLLEANYNVDAVDRAKQIYEKYAWAATPLKALLGSVLA